MFERMTMSKSLTSSNCNYSSEVRRNYYLAAWPSEAWVVGRTDQAGGKAVDTAASSKQGFHTLSAAGAWSNGAWLAHGEDKGLVPALAFVGAPLGVDTGGIRASFSA